VAACIGLAAVVAAALALWRNEANRSLSDRTMSKIRMAGFTRLGHDLESDSGSDPSTDGAGYMFYGPRLATAQLMASLSGVTVKWIPNLKPYPGGESVMVALGDIAGGCRVGIERMNRDTPAGFLVGASDVQVEQVRTGGMDILDVGVTCQ
jgi:hypothetical protein